MTPREKKLAAGLIGGAIALWQGWTFFDSLVLQPVRDREADIEARTDRVSDKNKKFKESRAAARKLDDWKVRSLPPDPRIATTLYQNWLVELAKKHLASSTVAPSLNAAKSARGLSTAKPNDYVYHRISATIDGQGTMSQLCDFLYEFRQSGLLHRVSRMRLETDKHQGKPVFTIALTVEGLALKDAPPRTTLFSDPKLAERATDNPHKERNAYEPIVAENLFVRGYNGPKPTQSVRPPEIRTQPRPPVQPTLPPDDPREYVYLVGSVSSDGSYSAMLYDRSTNKGDELAEGSEFAMAGVKGKVVAIGSDFITFSSKGAAWRLELGTSLAEMKKVGASSATSVTDEDPAPAETEATEAEPTDAGEAAEAPKTPVDPKATPSDESADEPESE